MKEEWIEAVMNERWIKAMMKKYFPNISYEEYIKHINNYKIIKVKLLGKDYFIELPVFELYSELKYIIGKAFNCNSGVKEIKKGDVLIENDEQVKNLKNDDELIFTIDKKKIIF